MNVLADPAVWAPWFVARGSHRGVMAVGVDWHPARRPTGGLVEAGQGRHVVAAGPFVVRGGRDLESFGGSAAAPSVVGDELGQVLLAPWATFATYRGYSN